ncbi:MAG: helix-hairpin-helix domain-containing protein [Opitutales bacterium]
MDEIFPQRRRKKVDREALQSPFSRIPGLDLRTVRDLLDLGFRQVDELAGRSPEALFEEVQNLRENTPPDRLWHLRLAVYFAETPEPDPARLAAWRWQ